MNKEARAFGVALAAALVAGAGASAAFAQTQTDPAPKPTATATASKMTSERHVVTKHRKHKMHAKTTGAKKPAMHETKTASSTTTMTKE